MKIIKSKIDHSDDRGIISDLIENEQLNAVTKITIKKGAVRGNHYHKNTWQWNYVVSGVMKLVTRMDGGMPLETFLNAGDLALTVPNEEHALVAVEDCEVLVFTKGPRGGKEYESDTYRLLEPLAI